LSNLIIKWATELHSVVKMKEDHAEIEESGRLIDTFIQDGVLWLRVGKLGGEGSDSFLRAIASSIMTIVTLGHLKGLVDLISKCWNGGPTEVQNCLEELNVREMTHSLNFEVGQLVPVNMMRFCDQSLYSRFIFGEIVAIASFESEWAANALTYAEYRGIVEDSGSGGQLARKYYLWEGGMAEDGRETLEVRPHVQVYKISRRRAQPPQLPHLQHDISDATQLQRSLAGVPTTATEAAATDDFSDLFDTLHQMLTMEKVAQRAYVRRLYLTWHPDKCEKPHAPRVFEYVRRFANLAQAGREDELRAFVTSLTPDVEMQVLHQGYEERQEHSWFDEFREEEERRAMAVASHQSVDGRSGNVAGSTSNHAGRSIYVPVARGPGLAPSSSSQQVPRLRDAALGDVAWQMAQAELDAARLLHGHQMWAQSVFHSHQAAEQVIKAAMLRTCGVTGDEFRGTGGHALDSLLRMTGLVSPVQPDELALLSQAYLGARYPPFPPRGAPTVPLAMYGAVDAENALEVAKKLIEWGRCTAQVEASLTAQRAVPQRVCDDNAVLLL
jgi:HEPN domain-containing protein